MSGSSLLEIMMLTYWIILNLTHKVQLFTPPPPPQFPLNFLKIILEYSWQRFTIPIYQVLPRIKPTYLIFMSTVKIQKINLTSSCQVTLRSSVWPWEERVLHFLNSSHNRRWPALTCLSVNCHESETVKEGSDCPPFLKSRWWQF